MLKRLTIVATVLVAGWLAGRLGLHPTEGLSGSQGFYGDTVTDGEVFEYIVVGAGAAGSAAAARLAQAGARVLLVEAGGDPPLLSTMPSAALTLFGTAIDWRFGTQPNNKSCLAVDGGACPFAGGLCVGGSTCLNNMLYTRGHRLDYDYGLPGWAWEDVRPYFLRSEGLYDLRRLPESSARHHATTGPIPIGYFGDSGNPWHERLIDGLAALDVRYNPDVSAESQIGVSRVLGYTSGGKRVNVADSYLKQNRVKDKLKLMKNTRCTGVIIDDENIARGITVSRGDENMRLYTEREVVLSAGVVGTPQLLMLSGIGPEEHLRSLGIAVRADLPVGRDMSDHVVSMVNVQVDDEYKYSSAFSAVGSMGFQLARWLAAGDGPLASFGLTDLTTFVNTECYDYARRRLVAGRPECELADLQLVHGYYDSGLGLLGMPALKRLSNLRDEFLEEIFNPSGRRTLISICPVVLRTESRGSVRLAGADPLVPPVIAPNYLDDDRDVEAMVRALTFVEQLVETPAFRRHNASIIRVSLPRCPAPGRAGHWACYARHVTHAGHHAAGTAALGRVLDARLRVRGVARLRAADASVLPRLPRGTTAAAIVAVGERLSDFLLEDRAAIN